MAAVQDRIILDVCNSHSHEIAGCAEQLPGMRTSVLDLQAKVRGGDAALQVRSQRSQNNAVSL